MTVEAHGIVKVFGSYTALGGVDLDVRDGEFCALLGPSGSGKTTLLRIIAGLETADAGRVRLAGADVAGRGAHDRKVGFVFQHYALFRHMTVFENVAFGLRVRPRATRPEPDEIRDRVMQLLELVQLAHFSGRFPNQISGGQRQRVALARALAIEPRLLLLDEPFGALDARVRRELRRWLRSLHDRLGLTSLFVTHDQEEALELADKVVVMNRARVEQVGSPAEIYDQPATPFVYEFIGAANRLDCVVEDGVALVGGHQVPLGQWTAALRRGSGGPPPDGPAQLFIRPHDFALSENQDGAGLPALVKRCAAVGPLVKIEAEGPAGCPLDLLLPRDLPVTRALAPGSVIRLAATRCGLFPAQAA